MSIIGSSRKPGPRPSTSRQEIVESTMSLLKRESTDALTFRAVARELGITVGALSRYFKNLADLQDEVAARIMSDLRPLEAAGKDSLRERLVRFGMDVLEINRAHPYLLKMQGPATAAVIGQHTRQSLKVLVDAGLDFENALAMYSLVGSLPYVWGTQGLRQKSPELELRTARALSEQLGEFAPQLEKMLSAGAVTDVFRRWLLIYIDGLLAGQKQR